MGGAVTLRNARRRRPGRASGGSALARPGPQWVGWILEGGGPITPFIIFGFASEMLLVAFFAAHLWRPAAEQPLGRLVYGMGLVAVMLAVAFIAQGQHWYLVLAFALYAAWAALGAWIDVIRPTPWREPSRLSILIPYAALLTAALLAFWVPLWWVDWRLWMAFAVLYVAHTTLNLMSHRAARRSA